MKFADLSSKDLDYIKELYDSQRPRRSVQKEISKRFGINARTVRKWVKRIDEIPIKKQKPEAKILIYDIETPRLRAEVWWSGNQYVKEIIDEPRIISICWKFYGDEKVYSGHWDLSSQCDKKMLKSFLCDYNRADIVVGFNNKNFDNRWVNGRAVKHKLDVNTFVRTLDLMKEAKRVIRVPSYSLSYLLDYFEIPQKKLQHEGIVMWKKIQYGTSDERTEYIKKMVNYNINDILATEALFVRMLPIVKLPSHLGVSYGSAKHSCPLCGEVDGIVHLGESITAAGTVSHLMQCKKDEHKYKISHRDYLNWLQ